MKALWEIYVAVLGCTVLYESIFLLTRQYGDRLAGSPILAVGIGGLGLLAALQFGVLPLYAQLSNAWKTYKMKDET
jgi:hypothetical protein